MRIACAQFMHETVTFLKSDTTREDFIYDGSPLGGEALLRSGKGSYMEGFVKVAREHSGVELLGVTSPMAPKTGITGSGWITRDAYEWCMDAMLRDLGAQGPLDGVYLALHGAMAVRGIARPEADIVSRVRSVVGGKPFIAATFDPHGNEDHHFFKSADLAFCAKYYPHYDEHLQGNRAARALLRAIRGDYSPVHATCKVPILSPTVMQCTDTGPWAELVRRALVWESRFPDLYINVFFGFPWADSVDAGMTLQATANGDPALARKAVQELAGFAWNARFDLVNAAEVLTIREAVTRAKQSHARRTVIADHSDRSGRATWLLREILTQGLDETVVATITDASVAQRLNEMAAKIGDPFDMLIGGGADESDGPPVRLRGTLRTLSPWVAVEFGRNNLAVITPYLAQIVDPGELAEKLGIDPAAYRVFVLKSRVHFRRGFIETGFAHDVIVAQPEASLLGTTRLDALPYQELRIENFFPFGRESFSPSLVETSSSTREK